MKKQKKSSKSNVLGVAFTLPEFNLTIRKRFSDELSVYTGEIIALLSATQWIEEKGPLISDVY